MARGRRRDAIVVVAAATITMLPWQLWSAKHAGVVPAPLVGTYGTYGAWWHQGYDAMGFDIFPRTLAKTVPQTVATFTVLFSPLRGAASRGVTLLLLLSATVAAVREHGRRIPVTLVFLVGYFAILELWPGAPTRMIWGLWPLFVMLFVAGARELTYSVRDQCPAVRVMAAAAVLWLAAGYSVYEWRGIRGRWWEIIPRGTEPQIRGLVDWTRENTSPEDVVATDAEGAVFLYSGRHTVPVRAFTMDQFLGDPTPAVEVARGLMPILSLYPVRAVATAAPGSRAAATLLAAPPHRALVAVGQFSWGAAFTVSAR